jgi:hypothetical protein
MLFADDNLHTAALRSVDVRLFEAAAMLGCDGSRMFRQVGPTGLAVITSSFNSWVKDDKAVFDAYPSGPDASRLPLRAPLLLSPERSQLNLYLYHPLLHPANVPR